jgi:hypothetical protein
VRSLVANLGYLPLGTISALIALRISRVGGLPARQRWAWRLMMTACLVMTAADIAWSIDENLRGLIRPAAGPTSATFCTTSCCSAGSCCSLHCRPGATRSTSLDLGIVMVGGGWPWALRSSC